LFSNAEDLSKIEREIFYGVSKETFFDGFKKEADSLGKVY